MKSFIMDKLYKRVEERGVVCLGLDTAVEYIPSHILDGKSIEEAIFEYNKSIIDETLDVVACFKVQIAYYEALGLAGLMAYKKTLEYLRIKDAIIIADIKRGDIMATATQYAKGHFSGDFEADFITLSPYMGMDSIEPYMPYMENGNKGVFVLVRTSNPGDNQYKSIHKQLAKVKPEKRELFEQRHSRELILYDAAARYLKELKDNGEAITPKAWQREIDQLTAGKQTDTLAMKSMREDLKAVERLRKTAEQLSRQERDKPHDREPER